MLKAMDYLDKVSKRGFRDLDALTAAISEALRADGIPHSPAQMGSMGICLTCNKTRLGCPGVHTFEEIQAAGRVVGA